WAAPVLSRRAVEHAQHYYDALLAGTPAAVHTGDIERIRSRLAALVDADPRGVTFEAGVDDAIVHAARAIGAPGRVVAIEGDASHLVGPFASCGHEIHHVAADKDG